MDRQNITIKNVSSEIVELLREIRALERRHLAVIIEDCVQQYWDMTYCGDD